MQEIYINSFTHYLSVPKENKKQESVCQWKFVYKSRYFMKKPYGTRCK